MVYTFICVAEFVDVMVVLPAIDHREVAMLDALDVDIK